MMIGPGTDEQNLMDVVAARHCARSLSLTVGSLEKLPPGKGFGQGVKSLKITMRARCSQAGVPH